MLRYKKLTLVATYYSDNNCATASYLANQGICDGFNGGPVGSFKVSCTD